MNANLLICPICKSALENVNDKSLICKNKHCFDISKKKYVNLINKNSDVKYTKEFFESRQILNDAGLYKPILNSIMEWLVSNNFEEQIILDVGCGEGYYSNQIASLFEKTHIYSTDISKDALVMARKNNRNISWFVSDLSNIPLQNTSVDLLLNIFAPANYSEFRRVLKEKGILIKVVPNKNHFIELRDSLNMKNLDNLEVSNLIWQKCIVREKKNICYKFKLNELKKDLINMSPIAFNSNKLEIENDFDTITVDVEIYFAELK